MAPLFLDPGLLRRRLVLEAPEDVSDGAGGARRTWREVREISAHVEPLSADRAARFDQHEATVTHRVICRFSNAVVRGRAFRLGARRLAIRTVHDPDETGRYLVCRCEEAMR